MKVSIGKNTLGGGKKMMTRLNNYNRSTHDNSFVMRTSIAPGVLVPTMTELLLPGDTYPIQTRCHTLTHPTIGPLFGSFKQQNDFFFCPIRLYNAMLHNNALNIGLDMKKVKFPVIKVDASDWDLKKKLKGSNDTLLRQIHPSSLLSYLGYKSFNKESGTEYTWNITKALMYYDIFKNYYANKQEESFYTIDGARALASSNLSTVPNTYFLAAIGGPFANGMFRIEQMIQNPTSQVIVIQGDGVVIAFRDLENYDLNNTYLNGKIVFTPAGEGRTVDLNMKSIGQLIGEGVLEDVSNLIVPISGKPLLRAYKFKTLDGETATKSINVTNKINAYTISGNYSKFSLSLIDDMRENILSAGKQQYVSTDDFITTLYENVVDIYDTSDNPTLVPNSAYPMVGLALKTYQSDINTNWVNTEWIDGETGINAITAIDTSSGNFTLDTLNLAKKVYTMLNRIAVSDGSYNAWIQTVYTSGGLNHIETPIYLGGSSLEIEFQEVVNNSGTENQPLGTLAGRGVATNHKGGNVIFKADEPGYIFCITSITPRVDYFQGNEWDLYLESLDDLHKPQLDGIGFQDRLYRHLNSSCEREELNVSIGKQPAWIQYMTNVNKTYGNFALIENEGWMCLNRIFDSIDTYTTYIQPHLYNNIFADTDLTAQNFWVQIAFNYKPRRVMSAKVIPNI